MSNTVVLRIHILTALFSYELCCALSCVLDVRVRIHFLKVEKSNFFEYVWMCTTNQSAKVSKVL